MASKQQKSVGGKAARTLNKTLQQEVQAKRAQLQAQQVAWKKEQQAAVAAARSKLSQLDEEIKARVEALQDSFDELQDDIMLSDVHQTLGEIEGMLATLAGDLSQLRARGYNYRSYLENKVNVLVEKWEALSRELEDDIEKQSGSLMKQGEQVARVVQAALGGNKSTIGSAESAVRSLGSKCSAARSAIQGRYRDVADTIRQTRDQLDEAAWAFDQAEQAKFDFLPSEFLVAATEAQLLDKPDGDEGEKGILYLTDERLLFEQKEQVATKKFLFITTESETVQALKFAALVGHISDLEAQDKQKFFSSKELLHLTFAPEAGLGRLTLKLESSSNEEWCQLINRVRSGEIARERVESAAEIKEEAAAKVSAAPTICSTCGGTLPTTIARGQSSISCEYCGAVIRL